jgi:UDP-3-O-[3-hydroxymyristoyl] glucosamine N-acyltransferase
MFNYDNRVTLGEFKSEGHLVRDAKFFGVGKIQSRVPHRLVPVANKRAISELIHYGGQVSAVICPPELVAEIPDSLGLLAAAEPLGAAYRVHCALAARPNYYWTDFITRISSSANVHPTAHVAERNVVIDDDVQIGPGAVVGGRVLMGKRVFVGANTVVGSNAFELVKVAGRNVLHAHAGGVRVESDAIFLSGVMVASSAFATFTEIGENSGFDNLVHVAHDCVVERGVQVTAGAVLAGRVLLHAESYVGPNATISNGLAVGASAAVSIGATVIRDVEHGTKVSGNFAIEHRKFMRSFYEQAKSE